MNAIYIYSSVSGLPVLEKFYGTAPLNSLPSPGAVFAVHQASLMMTSRAISPQRSEASYLSIRKVVFCMLFLWVPNCLTQLIAANFTNRARTIFSLPETPTVVKL